MRQAVRAIIIRGDVLLVMHRNKFGNEYVTLPGGKIELHESPEQALTREIREETTVTFAHPRIVLIEHAGLPWGDQYVFLCDYVSGEPILESTSEEALIDKLGKNLYQPQWLALQDISQVPFRSEPLKQFIVESIRDGWPTSAVEITTGQ